MKIKKLGLVIMSLLLTAPAFAVTTFSPSIGIQSNEYDNRSDEKEDHLMVGFRLTQSLNEKTSLRLEHRSYDYDYFNEDETTNSNRKTETFIYLDNKVLNVKDGLKLDINFGMKKENYVYRDSNDEGVDYRLQPRWKYPITEDITIGGNWLFYHLKNIDGRYDTQYGNQYGHELDTGITYTGIDKYKLDVSLYHEKHFSLMDDNDFDKELMQLRARVSTKLGKFNIAPWFGVQLGDYQITKSDGSSTEEGKTINRYGVDIATVYQDVRYQAQVYTQTATYDEDAYDYSRVYLRLSSTYRF